MTVESKNRSTNGIAPIATLKEALESLTAAHLHQFRKKWDFKNVSSLKKAELVDFLSDAIPLALRRFMTEHFDERRVSLIKRVIDNNGVINDDNVDLEELEYFPSTGFMFPTKLGSEHFVRIPVDLLQVLDEIIREADVRAAIKRNTEWIKITRALIYHYGVVSTDTLIELVEKYTPIGDDLHEYLTVLYDSAECYQEFEVESIGWSYWEVVDPEILLKEQASRKGLEYYPFTKEQLLLMGEPNMVEHPKGYSELYSLLVKEHKLAKDEATALLEDAVIHTKHGLHPSKILQPIQEEIVFDSLEDAQKLMNLLVSFMNHTRQWSIKGYTPNELSVGEKKNQQPLPTRKGEVINFQSKKKVGRNDPCPCGSGKKFKRCCGG